MPLWPVPALDSVLKKIKVTWSINYVAALGTNIVLFWKHTEQDFEYYGINSTLLFSFFLNFTAENVPINRNNGDDTIVWIGLEPLLSQMTL